MAFTNKINVKEHTKPSNYHWRNCARVTKYADISFFIRFQCTGKNVV